MLHRFQFLHAQLYLHRLAFPDLDFLQRWMAKQVVPRLCSVHSILRGTQRKCCDPKHAIAQGANR